MANNNVDLANDTNVTVSEDSLFDLDKMVNSAINIKSKFGIFGTSLIQIDEALDEFINGEEGIFIKTPVLGKHLNDIWHDLSFAQMGEFQKEFSGWSDLIRAAYVNNQTFTEEAGQAFDELLAATSEEAMLNYGQTDSSQGSAWGDAARSIMDYESTRLVYGITGARNITDEEYTEKYDSLNPLIQSFVNDKNATDAETFYNSYSRYLNTNEDLFYNILAYYNPEVERIVMERVEAEAAAALANIPPVEGGEV